MIEVCSIEYGLATVESEMNKEIRFSESRLEDLVSLSMTTLDRRLNPAIVIAVSCMTGKINRGIITLAKVAQYLFLSHKIHALVTDDDLSESARQYPVLTGDIMLGHTLKKVCDPEIFPYADQFVKLIKTINEGVLLRWRYKSKVIPLKDHELILSKEKASLTALVARLSAKLSGMPSYHIEKIEKFGYDLGMAWAASEAAACQSLYQEHLNRAEAILNSLRDHVPVKPLQEIMDFFKAEIADNITIKE
ncbi:hypothetical protein LPY66_09940 [Dehalobacter sp. DCM]|uniref:hypothetical protein n=1 Tax=Dehalobacter sp. DCM TaxID=2907827 RepID=UPI0030820A0B|nr:hypothetical protein LPY66_09940 [Dehalobacter sp. DCM]